MPFETVFLGMPVDVIVIGAGRAPGVVATCRRGKETGEVDLAPNMSDDRQNRRRLRMVTACCSIQNISYTRQRVRRRAAGDATPKLVSEWDLHRNHTPSGCRRQVTGTRNMAHRIAQRETPARSGGPEGTRCWLTHGDAGGRL